MIAVTGGTGLLGSHLLLKLAETETHIRALIRPGSDPEKVVSVWKHYTADPGRIFDRIEWHRVDMLNRASLAESIQGVHKLYHCAAKVSFDPRQKKQLWNSNFFLTRNIVDCCLETGGIKLIHTSSVAAIGKAPENTPADEQCGWPVKPASTYAQTKTMGELEVWRGITEGLDAVIVNPSVILGPGDWQTSSARIFDVVYRGLLFYPSGATGFVDARDAAEIMIGLGNSKISGERFIVNGANLSFKELFEKIAARFNRKPPAYIISRRMISLAWKAEWLLTLFTRKEPRISRQSASSAQSVQSYSSAKIREKTGFEFRPIDTTIQDIAGFYLNA